MVISKLRGLLHSNLVLSVAALASGMLAAWLGARHLEQRSQTLERESQKKYATAPYIVASRDVSRGQQIDASVLSIRPMPSAFAPADALSPANAGLLIGGRAAVSIRRGTPVVQAALAPAESPRLSEQLPAGMRAMTIQVDQVNALSGHLQAGDVVDLYYSRARGGGAVLRPLMQRVRVLATGQLTEAGPPEQQEVQGDFSTVTLLVSPLDAQRVVLAEQTGRLTLVLRRAVDESAGDTRALDSNELLKTAALNSGRRAPQAIGVELLTGGNGGTPHRSWLLPGGGA